MNLKETIRPITYLKNNAAEVVREAYENGRLMIVTQNGEAKAVVMGVDQYDEWKRALALLKLIAQSESDIQEGKFAEQKEVFSRFETIIKKAHADG